MDIEKLSEELNIRDFVIETRRHIHMHPELSEHEFETSKYICKLLDEWGVPYVDKVANTGIVATIYGKMPGKTVALRADIDALPIFEENGYVYKSVNDGVMHACGHDAHVAILLGACKILKELENSISGNIKFIFQPAEETVGGAKRMIEDGCLENPHVDYMLGLHVEPSLPTGKIGVKYDYMYAASDMFDLNIYGKSCHGAHPNEGVDTIVVMANVINAIQTIVSRNTSPFEPCVCTFGSITGGNVRNQIAEKTTASGIIRCFEKNQRAFLRDKFEQIACNVADAFGAEAEITFIESYGSLKNDQILTDLVLSNAREYVGDDNAIIEKHPDMGCEDFSYFANERPACYFHLGCGKNGSQNYDLHNSLFDLDEDCLLLGTIFQVKNVLSILRKSV